MLVINKVQELKEIQRRLHEEGLQDVKLAVNGTKEVDFFGHCGSLMPSTDEIVNKILSMKEGK